jgi:hypothetical protein
LLNSLRGVGDRTQRCGTGWRASRRQSRLQIAELRLGHGRHREIADVCDAIEVRNLLDAFCT